MFHCNILKNFTTKKCSVCVKLNSNSIKKIFSSSQLLSNKATEQIDNSNNPEENEDWFNLSVKQEIDERVVPKPVSYLPDHLPQTRKRIKQKPWWKYRYFIDINTPPLEEEEYTKEPEYPPIYDSSSEGIKKQIRFEWYDAIRRLPSAQQKIYEISKHYSHLSYCLEPVMKQYNGLPVQKYITKTHLINQLPDSYLKETDIDENLKQHILSLIASRLYSTKSCRAKMDFKQSSPSYLGFTTKKNWIQSIKEEDIVADIVQLIQNFKNQTYFDVQIDYNPYVATSWWVGDFPIPFKKKKWFKNETHNQCFLYKGNHSLHIRTEYPLPKIISMDDDLCLKPEFPKWNNNLLVLGVPLIRKYIMSLPGFWPDQSGGFDFPYLLHLSRETLRKHKEKIPSEDDQDILDGMAITSAFSWLTSIANNLGFTIYDRLTYPLVTQVILTDGQFWSFYVYQLNNHCFHEDIIEKYGNQLCNLCWSSGDMKLFDSFENGTLINVNNMVLNYLIKFLTIVPEKDVNYDLRPYLSLDERSQQDKDELSYSLRRRFANQLNSFIARRKKTNLWEKIYKNHKDVTYDMRRIRPKIEMKYPPFFK